MKCSGMFCKSSLVLFKKKVFLPSPHEVYKYWHFYEFSHSFNMDFKTFVCPHCSVEQVTKPENFKRHVKYCYKNPDVRFLFCPHCNQKFARPDNYKRHVEGLHHDDVTTEKEADYEKYDPKTAIEDMFTFNEDEESSRDPQFNMKSFTVDFKKKAENLARSGYMHQLLSRLFDYVIKKTNVRDPNMLCQVTIESKLLDYPIASGLHFGNKFDFNQIIDRFDQVSQSRRIFKLDDQEPEVTIRVFQRHM